MRRVLAVALVLLLALGLSGCSGGQEPAAEPIPTTALSSTSSGPALPPAPVFTDTMHLLEPPHVAGQAPDAAEPYAVLLQGDAPLAQHPTWRIPRPEGLTLVDASVLLWVDVQGQVVNTEPTGCFWQVTLLVEVSPGTYHVHPFCANDAQVVQPGTRSLALSTTGFDIRGDPGQEILVQVSLNGAVTPGSAVRLLTGSMTNDSTVTIAGLQLPVDTKSLL